MWEKNELGRYECFPRGPGPGSGVVDRDDVDKKTLCLRSSNHYVVDHLVKIDDF